MIIFHITDHHTWQNAVTYGIYNADSLESEGYIHCCMPDQLDFVIKEWFPGNTGLIILEINTDCLKSDLKFENLTGGKTQFPHVYGPINLDAITRHYPISNERN